MSEVINYSVEEVIQKSFELPSIESSSNTSLKRSIDEDIDDYPAKRANTELDNTEMGRSNRQIANGVIEDSNVIVEVITIPENAVGLIIGRSGQEIQNIQTQSRCRVQMNQEGEGDASGYRSCQLQGTKISVESAKAMINDVIMRANQRKQGGGGATPIRTKQVYTPENRHVTFEMMIPATKCGLVIGKQGDTIKQLQEQAGCKMIMIQDSQEVTGQPKPLRITGIPDKVELAKRLVNELLVSRDDSLTPVGMANNRQYHNDSGATAKGEVVVPRSSVGMIIGKGGETIKRLAVETGTKIQFKPDDDPNSADRCAVIMGSREQIYKATEMITELVHKSCNGGGPAGGGGPVATEVFYMHVPANKTGLVIGKGGETIKQINNESGAHCELSRTTPPNSHEKVFVIKGTTYQIHHAQHIIRIKVDDLPPGTPVPPYNGSSNGSYGTLQYNQQYGMQLNQWNGGWASQSNTNFYGSGAATQQYTAATAAQPATAQSAGPVINPQTGQPDYSAQWAEYYRSMGMVEQAVMIENQMKQTQAARATGAAGQQLALDHSSSFSHF